MIVMDLKIGMKIFEEENMSDLNDLQKQVYQNKLDKHFNVTDVSMEFALTYGELRRGI